MNTTTVNVNSGSGIQEIIFQTVIILLQLVSSVIVLLVKKNFGKIDGNMKALNEKFETLTNPPSQDRNLPYPEETHRDVELPNGNIIRIRNNNL